MPIAAPRRGQPARIRVGRPSEAVLPPPSHQAGRRDGRSPAVGHIKQEALEIGRGELLAKDILSAGRKRGPHPSPRPRVRVIGHWSILAVGPLCPPVVYASELLRLATANRAARRRNNSRGQRQRAQG